MFTEQEYTTAMKRIEVLMNKGEDVTKEEFRELSSLVLKANEYEDKYFPINDNNTNVQRGL